MNVSRLWLERFLGRPLEVRDLVERLAMLGAPVDAVEPLHADLKDVLIGLVEEVRVHPNADRLRLCKVNDGSGTPRSVVCGAPNVTQGSKYPFAPLGSVLPGAFKIEKRKIRGEVSEGMLCSARELGLGQDHEGIMELTTTAPPGTPFLSAIPVRDDRLVLDVSPNRPDLLGHKGVARELAASFGIPFRLPAIPGSPGLTVPAPQRSDGDSGSVGGVRVAIEDSGGCPRLLAAVLRSIQVGPSPSWLADRIQAVGMRPINNVVDATNYVMYELNQPMHAYDLARLRGPAVIARRARHGERVVTLDGVERILSDDMTVIADDGGAIGVAGVMGAAPVEVSTETLDVFLECAFFEPARIRRTRRTLEISTEASHRFERGVDRWGGPEALRRCIEIIQATAGGTLADHLLDVWPQPGHPPRIFLRMERIRQLLGIELAVSLVEQYLTSIGCTVLAKPEEHRVAVDVPGWRPDLRAEVDLIEEVARLHGYGHFPDELRPYAPSQIPDAPEEMAAERVRRGLVACGLFENMGLPLGPAEAEDSVRLINPLSAEEAHLRGNVLPGLVRRVEANWSARVRDIRLFELGTVFSPGGPGQRPIEERRVAGVISGAREPAHWTDGAAGGPDVDLWDLKGLFEAAIALAIPDAKLQVDSAAYLARDRDGRVVGQAARLVTDGPPWAAPVFGFEVVVEPGHPGRPRYRTLPATPPSERDLALLVPASMTAAAVGESLRRHGGELLEAVTIFDEYRGAGLPSGRRSVAFRLTFRAAERTLRDAEVDAVVERVLNALANELDVRLRTT